MGRGEARTGPPGAASSRGRRVLPPLVLAALAAVTVAAALLAWRAEVQDQAQADAAVAHEAADRAGAVFDGAFGLLRGVRGLYLASDRVSPEEFARFVTGAGERSALRSVAFAPLVPPAARAAWERATGRPVVAPGPDGRLRPVPATATALPIQ
jgi:CHASE1-domain containing sensor protein